MHEEGGKSTPNECSLRPVSVPPPLKMFPKTRISELAGRLRPLVPLERPVFPSFLNARQLRNLTPRKPTSQKNSINKLRPCLESLHVKDDVILLLYEGVLATTKAAATRKVY